MSAISTTGARIDRWDNGRLVHRYHARIIETLKLERSSRYLCSEVFITFISNQHDDGADLILAPYRGGPRSEHVLSNVRRPVSTKDPIPEEMDHGEIAVRMPMMDKMQRLFPSEPCKPLKPRSLHMVFLVEKDVRVERHSTCDYLNYKKFSRQCEVCASTH